MGGDDAHTILTPESFSKRVLESRQLVVVGFEAPWSGSCRAIARLVEQLGKQFRGKATIARIDIDEHRELAHRYGVRAIPSLLFFRDGKVVARIVGAVSVTMLAQKLTGVLLGEAVPP